MYRVSVFDSLEAITKLRSIYLRDASFDRLRKSSRSFEDYRIDSLSYRKVYSLNRFLIEEV